MQNTPRAAVLTLSHITKRFGGVIALNDVTLELQPGEVHGLIGPNGSGKTTLLNLLSGFYPPSEGTVRLGEGDLTKSTVQRRAQVFGQQIHVVGVHDFRPVFAGKVSENEREFNLGKHANPFGRRPIYNCKFQKHCHFYT